MSGRAARRIRQRILVTGRLVLETPAHFGNGDAEGLTDMPLLRHPLDGRPLLTGTSIAGALRSYLREYEHGYLARGKPEDLAEQLFGRVEGHASEQSWLVVDDALAEAAGVELRDGVAISPVTATAEEGKKFDYELLEAGLVFPLSFELLLTGDNERLVGALALALRGLEQHEIGLGLRKRRGLGQCRVEEWRVRRYDLTMPKGLVAWLVCDPDGEQAGNSIVDLLQIPLPAADAREWFALEATFGLPGSLLIRSGSGVGDSPDIVHLRSRRDGHLHSILSGTSLAGAVRARALRIALTIRPEDGADLVDDMFGRRIHRATDKPTGSRLVASESVLKGTRDLVQSRVKIDRFTGGSFPAALFTEQPAFGGDGAGVTLRLILRQPKGSDDTLKQAEIGLLLLVLKDLWTGDLPLGGESSVGRGRLAGKEATFTLRRDGKQTVWRLKQSEGHLQFEGDGNPDDLESCVQAFWSYGRG